MSRNLSLRSSRLFLLSSFVYASGNMGKCLNTLLFRCSIKTADNEKIPQTETPRRPAKAICTPQLPRLQGSLSLTCFYFLLHLLTLTPVLWC